MEFNEGSSENSLKDTNLQPLGESKCTHMEVNVRKALTVLKVPTPRQYCQTCLKKMKKDEMICCPTCVRATHLNLICAKMLFGSTSLRSLCIYCSTPAYCCLKCLKPVLPSEATIACSLCWREVHYSCFNLPLELFTYVRNYSFLNHMKAASRKTMVCGVCAKSKKYSIVESVVINSRKYYLLRIVHPSPCHYTWKEQTELTQRQGQLHELHLESLEAGSSKIDFVIGIFLPQSLPETYSLSELYHYFQRDQPKVPIYQRIKLLVKWSNSEQQIWQDETIARSSLRMVLNYLRLLSINYACISPGSNRTAAITSIVNKSFHREELMNKLSFVGGGALDGGKQEKSTAIVMSRVYENYLKNINQSIKSKKEDDPTRAFVLGSLLNTIYFFHKNISPAILLTTSNRIEWWIAQLRSICAYHTVIALDGNEQQICSRFHQCVSSSSRLKQAFWFNVLIVPYQHLPWIEETMLLSTFLDKFTLMVMDQHMNQAARNFYQSSKIPKIKMSRKAHELSSARDFKLANHSSVPSVSSFKEKSQECFNQMRSQEKQGVQDSEGCLLEGMTKQRPKQSEPDSQKQTNLSLIKHTLGWIKMDLDFKSQNTTKKGGQFLLNELQRVVYIRYILAFGMNFQSMNQLVAGLSYLEGSFFGNLTTANTYSILYNYTKQFLSIIYSSKDQLSALQQQQHKHYLFDVPAVQIKKRIVFLARLKNFYQKEHQSRVFNASGEEKEAQYLDLMIAQGILQRGYGRWQSVSQYARVWQMGSSTMSLRQFICNRADLKDITISMFCQFLKRRVSVIMSLVQAQFSQPSVIK